MKRRPSANLGLGAVVSFLLASSLAIGACGTGTSELALGVRYAEAAAGKLFALNEAFGRVVRIDPEGGVDTVSVGRSPIGLAATTDGAWVLTLSPPEETLYAVKADEPSLRALSAPVRPHHNALAVSRGPGTGGYAVTYVDLASLLDVEVEGTASFNEVVVVDLTGEVPLATPVVVGFNPRQVVFTPDGEKAVVLSESYASILTLATPGTAPIRVPLGANTSTNPVTPETVIVTADSAAALVARRDSADVFVIKLDPPSVNIIDVGLAPTKFVGSGDGSTVVAIRDGASGVSLIDLGQAQATVVPTAGPVTDAAIPPDPADRRVLLWGRGAGREEIYEIDLDAAESRTIRLVNPPTRVALGPGGASVVLHERQVTPDGDEIQRFFDAHESLSVIDPLVKLVTPIALDALPTDVAFGVDAGGNPLAWVTLKRTGRVARVELDTQLSGSIRVPAVPDRVLPMAPTPLAVAPTAILHDQPFGLVTFLMPGDQPPRVVSGFLLNGSLD